LLMDTFLIAAGAASLLALVFAVVKFMVLRHAHRHARRGAHDAGRAHRA
jgi:hypothetical protein